MAQKVPQQVLAYDLGGTKVAVGVVNSKGKILEELRMPVAIEEGRQAVMDQLAVLGLYFLEGFPKIARVGFASAGPLDPAKGVLLDPTNFVSRTGERFGKVPIASILSKKLKRPVAMENDAAAAILAEHWAGAAKGYENAIILTLGTGLGTGIVADGKLVRAGRGMHTEGGHIILHAGDKTAVCGCGNLGCAEAYLSGNGFQRRARAKLGKPEITAKEVADLARKGNRAAKTLFDEYAWYMAVAINSFAVLYAPEIVVLTGSFAAASDLFLPQTRKHLEKLLERRRVGVDLLPKIVLSKLHNNAGLLGGAYVAFHPER